MSSLEQLLEQAQSEVADSTDATVLNDLRVKYLGRKGALTAHLKSLGKMPAEQRAAAGKQINQIKQALSASIESRQAELEAESVETRLAGERLDVTLPGRGRNIGHLHPVTRTMRRMQEIFRLAGFDVRTGPEVEDDYHNFAALNFPEDHPARAMHDTLFLESGLLLRTHTSPVQVRAMREQGAPIRLIAPGRVYRCDSDPTHTPVS